MPKNTLKYITRQRNQKFYQYKSTSNTFALSTEQSFPCRFRAVSNATRAMRSIWHANSLHSKTTYFHHTKLLCRTREGARHLRKLTWISVHTKRSPKNSMQHKIMLCIWMSHLFFIFDKWMSYLFIMIKSIMSCYFVGAENLENWEVSRLQMQYLKISNYVSLVLFLFGY